METNTEFVNNMETKTKSKRKIWAGHCGYILSLFGYTSGSGDFWRFPYLYWKNGGGAFIIVYLFAVAMCSIPLYYLELTIAQYSGKGMYDVWCICPLFSGVGITMFIINIVILLIYPTMRLWVMAYIRHSFQSVLPWTTCSNSWNTDACVDNSGAGPKLMNESTFWNSSGDGLSYKQMPYLVNGTKLLTITPEEEFWKRELLRESSGIDDFGGLHWELVLYNFLYRGLVVLCVIKSVKSIEKVMYVTTVVPLLLLVTVWIRSLTLPGSLDGLYYLFKPDFSRLLDSQMWMEAGFMALNTVAIGMGGTLVVASRGKFNSGLFRSTISACTLDVFGSIFTSVVLFSVLGVMAAEQNKPISTIVTSGTSVGFVGFTKAFSYLPAPKVWTIIFFSAMLIALLDVIVITKEVVVYFVMNWFPFCRSRQTFVILSVFILSFILSLPLVTQAGPYIFQIAEWYYGSWCTLITSLCEIIICMWIFGGDRIDDIIRPMIGKPMPAVLRFLAAFVCPTIVMIFLVTSIAVFRPPTYGDYHYPVAAEVFGYFIGVLPVLPIPIVMAVKIYKLKGPLSKRIKTLLKPGNEWGPVETNLSLKAPTNYTKRPVTSIAYYNVTGRHRRTSRQNDTDNDEMVSIQL